MPLADRLVRWAVAVSVVIVTAVSMTVSYSDIRGLVLHLGGESNFIASIFPVSIDGLLVTANLAMLFCSRYEIEPNGWIGWSQVFGIVSTLIANVSHGLHYSVGAALIGAWPALSLVLASELLFWLIDASRELDTKRTVFVVPKPQGPNGNELTKVTELIANERGISAAEVARQTGIPYARVLGLTKQAKALLNGSH